MPSAALRWAPVPVCAALQAPVTYVTAASCGRGFTGSSIHAVLMCRHDVSALPCCLLPAPGRPLQVLLNAPDQADGNALLGCHPLKDRLLHFAAENGMVDEAALLIARWGPAPHRSMPDHPAQLSSADASNPRCVYVCVCVLRRGADPELPNSKGYTQSHIAEKLLGLKWRAGTATAEANQQLTAGTAVKHAAPAETNRSTPSPHTPASPSKPADRKRKAPDSDGPAQTAPTSSNPDEPDRQRLRLSDAS